MPLVDSVHSQVITCFMGKPQDLRKQHAFLFPTVEHFLNLFRAHQHFYIFSSNTSAYFFSY